MLSRLTKKYSFISLIIVFTFTSKALLSQTLSGKITDENKNPVPYASVYVKEAKQGTTSNTDGIYLINLPAGNYNIIFRCLGFEIIEKKIDVKPGQNQLNIILPVRPYQIAPVTIGSKNEDPAYGIVRKAIGMAPYYQNQVKEFNAEVYLKGTAKVKKLSWVVKKAIGDEEDAPKEGQLYMQESINTIHFVAPEKYEQKVKMIRSNLPGDNSSTNSIMQFLNASFYQPQIADIILPLSPYALKHYNFKYDGFSIQGDRVINRIKVIPKRKSKQLVEGYMYIADDYYNLHEVDFSVETIVGFIKIKQTFGEVDNNVWLPISHHYEINGDFMGSQGDAIYISSIKYSDIKINTDIKAPSNLEQKQAFSKKEEPAPIITPKASSKQQAKDTKNAEKIEKLMSKETLSNREMYELAKLMDKKIKQADTSAKSLEIVDNTTITVDSMARKVDSTQWNAMRPIVLNAEEVKVNESINQKLTHEKDGPDDDSLKSEDTNLAMAILMGKTWQNEDKNQRIRFSGLINPNEFRFNTVDGFVMGSAVRYRRQFSNTTVTLRPSVSYAFSRKIPMGTITGSITYAHKQRGVAGFNAGITSVDFNQNTGISNITNTVSSLFFGRNYMKLFENKYFTAYNRIDVANGLELFTSATYSIRNILENNTRFIMYEPNRDWYTPNNPQNELITPQNLDDSKAFIGNIRVSYTPFYHYRIRDNRKVMLYSKFPTFSVQTKFAIPGIMNSNANFINLEASINQSISTGPNSKIAYSLTYGDFLSKKNLYFNDFAHFNTQITPITARQFNNSYQGLSYYTRSTNSAYGEIFVNYNSPYLALKYLPFLSNRMWQENLYFSSLITKNNKPYYEVGYSMSQIGAIASVGVFAGFNGAELHRVNLKLSLLLSIIDM